MNAAHRVGAWIHLSFGIVGFMVAGDVNAQTGDNEIRVEMVERVVELSTDRGNRWVRIQSNQALRVGDRLRTGPNSRAAVRLSASTVLPFSELTEIEIVPPEGPVMEPGLHIFRGLLNFFHKGKPARTKVITPSAVAGVDGTEFVIAVDTVNGMERTTLAVIDGRVSFGNGREAPIILTNGERAIVDIGGRPVRIAGFIANNILQWAFYYPAVLEPEDLSFSTAEKQVLRDSLDAYRDGDLLAALDAYGDRSPASDGERIYFAALLLSVGQVTRANEALLKFQESDATERHRRLSAALRMQIAAVKGEHFSTSQEPDLTTELLAASYYTQSRARGDEALQRALALAKRAATNSPEFGFAWARVAELEFGFGRNVQTKTALDRSLALSPRNAQALALNGFTLAAQNKSRQAIEWFDRAIAVDPAHANAWLGRGLCRIRRGNNAEGQNDLLVAAALEPRRAQLRSYLGKAYESNGDTKRALHELEMAQEMDPGDPTAWFYSALVKAEQNRINEAIGDLERSQQLNDNRSVYRSSLLLDQDRAVRTVNLARIYAEAGMTEVSLREAVRAVNADYANYSAHLFLATSYDQLRDPNRVNLRYETPSEVEYLVANLLAPISAGVLSPAVSQQEYFRLFQRDHFGVVSATEYLSRGAWTQSGAQFGSFERFGYSLEASYRSDNGHRPNNDFTERLLSLRLKQEITASDILYAQITDYSAGGGDLAQHPYQWQARRGFHYKERKDPTVIAGYHHEWNPGMHTLAVLGRLDDTVKVFDPVQRTLITASTDSGRRSDLNEIEMQEQYRNRLEIYSSEVQQIFQTPSHTTIVGGRFQSGDFDVDSEQNKPSFYLPFFEKLPVKREMKEDFERVSGYAYHNWKIHHALQLAGGVSYDLVRFPDNFRSAPLSHGERTIDAVSPKAGFIWEPLPGTTIRGAYTRGLSGATLDQSYQLEPSQVAGFNQSFRSILPESVGGAEAGAKFETYGLSIEQKFPTRTYLGFRGEILSSSIQRTFGAFNLRGMEPFFELSNLREHLEFDERSLLLTVNQLAGTEWAFGAQYRVSQAELQSAFPQLAAPRAQSGYPTLQKVEALLQQASIDAIYNHVSGVFASGQAVWYHQDNDHYQPSLDGDAFWQLNAWAGYHFHRRKATLAVGLLNITDTNYRLNPLNLHNDLPRERTLALRFHLNF